MVPLLAAYVKEQGHDDGPILHLPGIRGRDLKDPDVRVPERASREAWRLAMVMTADEAIGLHVAEWLPRGALDLIDTPSGPARRSVTASIDSRAMAA